MKSKLLKLFSSYYTMVVLMVLYALVLAIATAIEKFYGTPMAKSLVYHSVPFIILHILLVINFACSSYKFITKKRIGLVLVHGSFIIILLGAMTSFIWSLEGILHLREGQTSDEIIVTKDGESSYHKLPFSVELEEFNLHRYPGSDSPSSYESNLLIYSDGNIFRELIYMNNVLDIKGYRFYQASFDSDEHGTVLSVNKDVAGRNITYTGYTLLFIGLVLSLIGKNSRFNNLRKKLKQIHSNTAILIMLCMLASAHTLQAQEQSQYPNAIELIENYPVSVAHAANFGALPIQSSRGRIMPINTFSSEILRKVHKSSTLEMMNSDQFLLSYIMMPELWAEYPLIAVPSKEVAAELNLDEELCRYVDLFNADGEYILQPYLVEIYNKEAKDRDTFDKDILKLDERINTLFQLSSRKLLNIFPKNDDPNHKWYAPGDDLSPFAGQDSLFVSKITDWYIEEAYSALGSNDWSEADRVLGMIKIYQTSRDISHVFSQKKLDAEIRYNKLNIFKWCKMGLLIFGGLLLVLGILGLFKPSKIGKILTKLLTGGVIFVFIYQLIGVALRWYISGNAPSNSYETMILVSLAVVMAGLIFAYHSSIAFALATIFGGVILFVSSLSWMDPHISPLVPVLKSPWLISHVTTIIIAYGFMGISFFIGITNMILLSIKNKREIIKERINELTIINEMSLWLGVTFLTVGIFLGAIWANESWGRYWGWDPKEVWALITMIVYSTVLHIHLIKRYNNVWHLNFWATVSFSSVIMTYFGVNFLLSGMHSYGNTEAIDNLIYYLLAIGIVIGALSFAAWRGYRQKYL
ncbi:MAG: cytochrome c biogenesis protein CcsA [Rikenellaceae bacterium]